MFFFKIHFRNLERSQSNELLKVNLKTLPLWECNETVLEYNRIPDHRAFRSGLIEGQYCAHDSNRQRDSCQGDSGGPLQIKAQEEDIAKVVGIVSFGVSCATFWPGIYTRVVFTQLL